MEDPFGHHGAYHWLSPEYRQPPCSKCRGRNPTCERCGGSGRGAPVFSRTDAIRRTQEASGHAACYGVAGKLPREPGEGITPTNCGDNACRYKQSCTGLHLDGRYQSDRIREESIEYLSRLFLNARAIERRGTHLTPFQDEVARLVRGWADDTPQVAVLGAFSSGKSTLLNRLVKGSYLPAARTPTTAVLTSLKYDDHCHGVLHYRSLARLKLVSQDARSPDHAAIEAMRSWIRDPGRYGVQGIRELDAREDSADVDREVLLRELDALADIVGGEAAVRPTEGAKGGIVALKRAIGKRSASPTERLARTFEIFFQERQPQDFDLARDDGKETFGRHLTDPSLALSLNRAICYLPVPRLQSLNLMDTAGLCSPVGFHKDVTAELLRRRPDKILVLLDARRLDSPTNREALRVLGRFVSVPDDYRQVTFALTFWDLALRTHMVEDSEPELDFNSPSMRAATEKSFARRKREELVGLLSSSVGVPCDLQPVVFTLGLGTQAPPEMGRSLEALWSHLEGDCSGWVGVEMWADRWRAAREYTGRLLELHRESAEEVEEAKGHAGESADIDADLDRLNAQEQSVRRAGKRAEIAIRDVLEAQKRRMLAEIAGLGSKSALLGYLNTGYLKSAVAALGALREESKRQNDALRDLYRGARVLRSISLNRKLLGLDATSREQAKGEVTGFLYGLQSIWDFLLGGVLELNERHRAAAREILRGQARDTIDLLDDAVVGWAGQVKLVCEQARAEYAEKRESLSARKADATRYAEGLQRKSAYLGRCVMPLRDLCSRVEGFADDLAAARSRIAASRQPDFRAVLFTDDGEIELRKGREHDLLMLYELDRSRWKRLEIRSGGRSRQFVPAAKGVRRKRVAFVEEDGTVPGDRRPVVVPDGANRFELRLSTLEGEFRFTHRSAESKRGRRQPVVFYRKGNTEPGRPG